MHKIFYNGHWSDEFGIRIESAPTIVKPARKFKSASVMGRNGNIYALQDAFDEVIVSYKIFAGSPITGINQSVFTSIIEWLNGAEDYSMLMDTYDPDHYRKAVYVDSVNIDNIRTRFGKATINFRCRPERFKINQTTQVSSGDTVTNPTNHNAFPEITLTGGGARSLIKLTDKVLASASGDYTSLSAFVPSKDTSVWSVADINRTKIRFFNTASYTSNISNANGSVEVTAPSTAALGVGLLQSVQADSDYTLSLDMYVIDAVYDVEEERSVVAIYYVSATGNNDIIGYKNVVEDESYGWKHMRLTFHTPAECGYVFIVVRNPFTTDRTIKFKNLMLNGGQTEKAFRPYDDSSVSQIQINDTILEFTINGYDTAVIDCDKEDVTIDDVNGNPVSKITDIYGNMSASYLQLLTGDNTISFNGDIVSVMIDKKIWEL